MFVKLEIYFFMTLIADVLFIYLRCTRDRHRLCTWGGDVGSRLPLGSLWAQFIVWDGLCQQGNIYFAVARSIKCLVEKTLTMCT